MTIARAIGRGWTSSRRTAKIVFDSSRLVEWVSCAKLVPQLLDGGRLRIETANHSLVGLSVTDFCTGMTDEVPQRAFDPFYTTKPLGQAPVLGCR